MSIKTNTNIYIYIYQIKNCTQLFNHHLKMISEGPRDTKN